MVIKIILDLLIVVYHRNYFNDYGYKDPNSLQKKTLSQNQLPITEDFSFYIPWKISDNK